MEAQGQTVFLVERLSYAWFNHSYQRRIQAAIFGLVFGVIGSISLGLYFWSSPSGVYGHDYRQAAGIAIGLVIGVTLGIVIGRRDIDVEEQTRLKWNYVGLEWGLIIGIVVGLMVGLVLGLVIGLAGLQERGATFVEIFIGPISGLYLDYSQRL
ncbi:MAG: hypothetical protein IPK16_25890 [Anaerolineales bacterium]|nr:hypothetical protein [Anaerolineales bacterium]